MNKLTYKSIYIKDNIAYCINCDSNKITKYETWKNAKIMYSHDLVTGKAIDEDVIDCGEFSGELEYVCDVCNNVLNEDDCLAYEHGDY